MECNFDLQYMIKLLKSKRLTFALAESCTGGLVSSIVTSESGASEFFLGGTVTYSNDSKESILGVDHSILVKYGAVSEETAIEMVKGVRRVYMSDIAAAVTGIAGPSGGSNEKPVGLVHIAVTDGKDTVSSVNVFGGSRTDIRYSAAEAVIRDVITLLEGKK
ncbi:MAG: CinA family protein [Candidatus Methanomethylophilaceae archaeon]|jgi:nicotinamide-nucleotide amidase